MSTDANNPLKPDPIRQRDRNWQLVLPKVLQKGVLKRVHSYRGHRVQPLAASFAITSVAMQCVSEEACGAASLSGMQLEKPSLAPALVKNGAA